MRNKYLHLLFEKKTAIILILLMIVLLGFAKSLVFVVGLLLINVILGLIVRPFKYFLAGIEIVTLITIVTSLAYGAVAGMIAGAIALLTNLIAIGRTTPRAFLFVLAMIVLAWLPPTLAGVGAGITAVGIGANIAYNLVVLVSIAIFGGDFAKGIIYVAINTVFNVFLFTTVAPGLVRVMG